MMDRAQLKSVLIDQLATFKASPVKFTRQVNAELLRQLANPEISVITGVRRSGKSTLMRQAAKSFSGHVATYFIDLESPLLSTFEPEDFGAAYSIWMEIEPPESRKICLCFDELQVVEGWERWVRFFAEKPNHKVIITGSNSEMLSSELASSLTGRHQTIHVTPFTIKEIADNLLQYNELPKLERHSSAVALQVNLLVQRILKFGVFPRSFLEQSTELLPFYYNDIITRDIVRRRSIRNTTALVQLGDLLARENTRVLNRAKTGDLLGLKTHAAIGKYIDYFKECYLYSELRTYSPSLRKKLRSHSKLYCVDPVLPSTVSSIATRGVGGAFENLVYLELKNLLRDISYWHSKDNFEVDFVGHYQGELYAIQAAFSIGDPNTAEREVRALQAAHKELKLSKLIIVTADEEREISIDSAKIQVIPIRRFAEGAIDV